jgi:hypothetical protein
MSSRRAKRCAFPSASRARTSSSTAPRNSVTFLAISSHGRPDIVEYPDSGKVGVGERLPRGGGLREFFRRAEAVDYWDGEQRD